MARVGGAPAPLEPDRFKLASYSCAGRCFGLFLSASRDLFAEVRDQMASTRPKTPSRAVAAEGATAPAMAIP